MNESAPGRSGRYPALQEYDASKRDPLLTLGNNVTIDYHTHISGRVVLEDDTRIGFGTLLLGDRKDRAPLIIGKGTRIGPNCIIRANKDKVMIGEDVSIGPNCIINYENSQGMPSSGPVIIGTGSRIGANSYIGNHIDMGKNNVVSPGTRIEYYVTMRDHNWLTGCFIGVDPQDRTFYHELEELAEEQKHETATPTYTIIGSHNLIREGVRISRGTAKSSDRTTHMGDHNLIMDNTHIAHDCVLGNNITITTGSKIAGHVHIEDYANLAGSVKVAPFIHIGRCAYIMGNSGVGQDIPPLFMAKQKGDRIRVSPLPNKEGIQRMLRASQPHLTQEECDKFESDLTIMSKHISKPGSLDDLLRHESPLVKTWAEWMKSSAQRNKQRRPRFRKHLEPF